MSAPYSGITPETLTTSRQAAGAAEAFAPSLREQVFAAIEAAGDEGKTDDELMADLGLRGSTEHPRRWELLKAGRIKPSGKTRLTQAGRNAIVWVAVPKFDIVTPAESAQEAVL